MLRPFVITLFACLLAVTGSMVVRADDSGPAKDVPELQVLQHYAGTWDVELTDNASVKREATAEWILGGRFLEQAGVMHSQDGKDVWHTALFTFDTEKRATPANRLDAGMRNRKRCFGLESRRTTSKAPANTNSWTAASMTGKSLCKTSRASRCSARMGRACEPKKRRSDEKREMRDGRIPR
jgi:hypothetical protein